MQVVMALMGGAGPGHAQTTCPSARPPVADVGVGMYHCIAGSCGIRDGRDARFYTFSVEPRVWNIAPDGPAAGALRDRDVIVRVDGLLITSPEGGRHLANLAPGEPVRLTIRRDGVERAITITTREACSLPMLIWTRDPTGAAPRLGEAEPGSAEPVRPGLVPSAGGARPGPPPPAASLGLSVSCSECGWYFTPAGDLLWRSATDLEVVEVEPGGPAAGAGLAVGDLLTHIDGASIRSTAGGGRLARVQPGEEIEIRYVRGAERRTVTLRAGPPPD